MSAQLTLPCGCRITEVFVISVCMQHDCDFTRMRLENEKAYRLYEQQMRKAHTSNSCASEKT